MMMPIIGQMCIDGRSPLHKLLTQTHTYTHKHAHTPHTYTKHTKTHTHTHRLVSRDMTFCWWRHTHTHTSTYTHIYTHTEARHNRVSQNIDEQSSIAVISTYVCASLHPTVGRDYCWVHLPSILPPSLFHWWFLLPACSCSCLLLTLWLLSVFVGTTLQNQRLLSIDTQTMSPKRCVGIHTEKAGRSS